MNLLLRMVLEMVVVERIGGYDLKVCLIFLILKFLRLINNLDYGWCKYLWIANIKYKIWKYMIVYVFFY